MFVINKNSNLAITFAQYNYCCYIYIIKSVQGLMHESILRMHSSIKAKKSLGLMNLQPIFNC